MRREICAVLLVGGLCGAAIHGATITIVHLSDMHYDPYYGTDQGYKPCAAPMSTPYGVPGCDTSATLATSVVEDIAKQIASSAGPVLLLYTGDYLRHDMAKLSTPEADAKPIFTFVANLFHTKLGVGAEAHSVLPYRHHRDRRRTVSGDDVGTRGGVAIASPAASIAGVLGNEDFVPDYTFNFSDSDGTPLLQYETTTLEQLGYLASDQVGDFVRCGYAAYNVTLGAAGPSSSSLRLRVISLNTVLYSVELLPSTTANDPCGQFAWFTQQLKTARAEDERVYIVGHIPPSSHYWHYHFVSTYETLVGEYSSIIAAQLFGHTHRLSFGAMGGSMSTLPPMFLAGGITRKDYSNPQYSIMTADANTGDILTLRSRFLSPKLNGEWVMGGELSQVLGIANLNMSSLYNAGQTLLNDGGSAFSAFFLLHEGGVIADGVSCGHHCRNKIACDTIAFSKSERDDCLI